MKQWYEELYENSAESYDNETFVQGTEAEVNFLEKEINYDRSVKILDIGCGTGRHCLELAKRGYQVTGIDLSTSLLHHGREKAKKEGLNINFIEMDARFLTFKREFDLVICMCEGAFSLMEEDEMDQNILEGAEKALKDKGKFILTTGNALYQLQHPSKNNTFDVTTLRETFDIVTEDDSGQKKVLHCTQRYYMPSEIAWRLKNLGFKTIEFFSCQESRLSREHKLSPDDFEMLVIAEK